MSTIKENSIFDFKLKSTMSFYIFILMLFLSISSFVFAEVATEDQEIIWKMGEPFYSGQILPRPKEASYLEGSVVLIDGKNNTEYYSLGFPQAVDNEKLIQHLFKKHIDRYSKLFSGQWKKAKPSKQISIKFYLENYQRAERIEDTYGLYKKTVILRDQGYILEIGDNGIVCIGKDNAGLVNGLVSIIQLFDVKNGNLVVHKARIFDYPITPTRLAGSGTKTFPDTETLDWLMLYKINGWSGGRWYLINWAALTDAQKQRFKKNREYTKSRGTLTHVPQIHLEGLKQGKDSPRLDIGNPENVRSLLNTVKDILTIGGDCYDIFILGEDSLNPYPAMPMEKEKFKTLAEAHGYILKKVWETMQKISPESKLYFCPPSYSVKNLKHETDILDLAQYLEDTKAWNENIILTWTGSSTYSVKITYEDIDYFRQYMGYKRKLMLWDNTWNMRCPLSNCFIDYPEYFANYCDIRYIDARIASNDPFEILTSRLYHATAVDHYWDPPAFDEIETRKIAIAQFFGEDAVPYAERYYKLRSGYYSSYEKFHKGIDLEEYKEILDGIGKSCNIQYDDIKNKKSNSFSGVKRYMAELWKNYEFCKSLR